MAKQSGKSKRPRSASAAARGTRSYASAQKRHLASFRAQEQRAAANRDRDGLTAWQLALQARASRRAILAAAWAAKPWRPGDVTGREKSVREWTLAHSVSIAQPA